MTEYKIIGNETYLFKRNMFENRHEVLQQKTHYLEAKGQMATALIERWGLVAAEDGGEDGASRAKLRLMTPEEVVQRACDTAHLAIESFKSRGWLHEVPLDPFNQDEDDE